MKIRISEIRIEDRTRREHGDLQSLADSINLNGLLQPIGITGSPSSDHEYYTLVFGERRLRACRDILGWDFIEAVYVEPASPVEGEYAENVHRKDFSPSEKVEIANRIKDGILGNRQGKRTDIEPPQKIGEVEVNHGDESGDVAARIAGLGNKETYRQAKKVIANGIPELVEAMDSGIVSISNAAIISRLPKEKQAEVMAQGNLRARDISEEPIPIPREIMKKMESIALKIVDSNKEYLGKNNSFVIPVSHPELGKILVQVTRR